MAQATFLYGEPVMIPYTPSGAVTAGDVIIEGDRVYIAHLDIAAGTLGSVAAGGGVYEFVADGSSGPVIDMGDDVYWDDSGNEANDTPTSNTLIGGAAADKGASDATIRVVHALR